MHNQLFNLVMNNRAVVSLLLVVVTALLGWSASKVQFDNSIETYFLEEDIREYRVFLDQFGSDEIIGVVFSDEEIFTSENLHLIQRITAELEQYPHVRRVDSLTSAEIVFAEGDEVHFDFLADEIPSAAQTDAEKIATIKRRALADPFVPGTLISRDGKHTAIVAEIDHIIGEFDYKVELIRQIEAFLGEVEKETGREFLIGGTAVIDDAVFRYNQQDQERYIPLMVLLVIAIVFFMFRRLELVTLPLIIVLLTVIWTYGLLVLLGYKINIISTIITPLLMTVAIADSMHFIAHYLQAAVAANRSKIDCIREAFNALLTPCLMTSTTTAFGLLALLSADLVPIRQFGLVAACGVLFAFLISMLLLPILLSILPYPQDKQRVRIERGGFSRLLKWLGNWQRGRAIGVVTIATLVVIPAILSLSQITVGTSTLDYLRKDDPVRLDTERIDSLVGGSQSLEFMLEGKDRDTFKNPELLRRMAEFEEYLRGIQGITGVYSVVEMTKSLNQAFNEGQENFFSVPNSARLVAQQLLLVEGSDELRRLVSDDYSVARITARVELKDSQQLAHQMPEVIQRMEQIFEGTVKLSATGVVHLTHQMEIYLLSSQIKSILLAFGVISIAMLIFLRSLKLGLLAMVPNLLPIVMILGLMPLFGISLDVGTVMIASVALGMVVDDTIHFLTRFKREAQQGHDTIVALSRAINICGRPIIFTSIALSLGFLVLIFASFNPIIHFGLLTSLVIVLAVLFDLLVLPAILGLISRDSLPN